MKKTTIIFVLLITILNSASSQQDSSRKAKFIIKTDVLLPTIGLFSKSCWNSLTIERYLNNRHSIQLSGLYAFHNDKGKCEFPYPFGSYLKYKTFKAIIDYKYYVSKKKFYSNIFIGLSFEYINRYQIDEYYGDWPPYYQFIEERVSSLAFVPILGYQNYFLKNFTYEFLIGFGICHIINSHVIDEIGPLAGHDKTNYANLRMAINIGYKF